MDGLKRFWREPNVQSAFRVFIITSLVLFIPGLLGWLGDLMDWADSEGKENFPEVDALAYLAISALIAGIVAVLNFAWGLLEDFMRRPPAGPTYADYDNVHDDWDEDRDKESP